jgi:DNA phosphorothioation-dependent restriction protein DptG
MDWSEALKKEPKLLGFKKAVKFIPQKNTEFERLTLELLNRILDGKRPTNRGKCEIYDCLKTLIEERQSEIGSMKLNPLLQKLKNLQQQQLPEENFGPSFVVNYINIWYERQRKWRSSTVAVQDVISIWAMLKFFNDNHECFNGGHHTEKRHVLRTSIRREVFRYMKAASKRYFRDWTAIKTAYEISRPDYDPFKNYKTIPWPIRLLINVVAVLHYLVTARTGH